MIQCSLTQIDNSNPSYFCYPKSTDNVIYYDIQGNESNEGFTYEGGVKLIIHELTQGEINISNLCQGIFWINLKIGNKIKTQRIIKE